MAIKVPAGENQSSITTQLLQAQHNAEANVEPTPWEPVPFNGEGEGALAFETPTGRRLECRVEAQGTIVRLRGAIKLKAAKELKSGVAFATMPTSASGVIPNTRPEHTKEHPVASTQGYTVVTLTPVGEVKLSLTQAENAVVSFDGVTYDLS